MRAGTGIQDSLYLGERAHYWAILSHQFSYFFSFPALSVLTNILQIFCAHWKSIERREVECLHSGKQTVPEVKMWLWKAWNIHSKDRGMNKRSFIFRILVESFSYRESDESSPAMLPTWPNPTCLYSSCFLDWILDASQGWEYLTWEIQWSGIKLPNFIHLAT